MPTITVRNLPDEVHRALRVRAAHHGRSTEAEIRDILESTVRPPERIQLGTWLFQAGRKIGLTDADVACIEQGSDRTPIEPVAFE
ncbi:MAG: Arc family DNA-binding protein [Burkholderiaceae bacterium]|nr:Arc family DNA-binding protein [Burkholderiaceae bacterium]